MKSNEVTYKTQINQLNLDNAKIINGLESAIKEKDIALKNLTDNQAREIATSKVKAENEFKDQINALNQTIADLNNKLSALEKDANARLTNLTLQKNSELESKIKTNEVTYKAQINQINLNNAKVITGLESTIKEKDIALKNLTDNQVKEIEISKVKIENQYKDKLNALNENITSLKNTLESTIAQKDSDKELTVAKLTQEYSDKLSKKNEEISTLKQLNSENRIIQNKTKGEN
jgi:DNA repair exonuclease SbcCD ATPase subunit